MMMETKYILKDIQNIEATDKMLIYADGDKIILEKYKQL